MLTPERLSEVLRISLAEAKVRLRRMKRRSAAVRAKAAAWRKRLAPWTTARLVSRWQEILAHMSATEAMNGGAELDAIHETLEKRAKAGDRVAVEEYLMPRAEEE